MTDHRYSYDYYNVADFTFRLALPAGWDPSRLLPSFRPFACAAPDGRGETPLLFRMEVLPIHLPSADPAAGDAGAAEPDAEACGRLLEEGTAEAQRMTLRLLPDGTYRADVRTREGGFHRLETRAPFTAATVRLSGDDPRAGAVLGSMARFVFSQAVLPLGGLALHASVVALGGRGYLFMGRSGTGKSTHSRLWMETFAGCRLLNDDNPAVRLLPDGTVTVYGTPWSGKTPCYRNERYTAGGFLRLVQAPANRFLPCSEDEAFAAILPGCALFAGAPGLRDALCDTLAGVVARVPAGILECRPDTAAARLAADSLGALLPEEGK